MSITSRGPGKVKQLGRAKTYCFTPTSSASKKKAMKTVPQTSPLKLSRYSTCYHRQAPWRRPQIIWGSGELRATIKLTKVTEFISKKGSIKCYWYTLSLLCAKAYRQTYSAKTNKCGTRQCLWKRQRRTRRSGRTRLMQTKERNEGWTRGKGRKKLRLPCG